MAGPLSTQSVPPTLFGIEQECHRDSSGQRTSSYEELGSEKHKCGSQCAGPLGTDQEHHLNSFLCREAPLSSAWILSAGLCRLPDPVAQRPLALS